MLRITQLDSAEQARKYYIQRQSLEAYYTDNQEFNGYWGGKGAAMLGLTSYMKNEEFSRLLDNLHPATGERLTQRMRSDRRPGFDITFDVPKSVSLAYAATRNERIIQAVRKAVWQVNELMEDKAATRVRAGLGNEADGNRLTKVWVGAEFIHLTARPEDGSPDPHIHVHLVIMNATFDPVEKKWKALQMGDIHKQAPSYQDIYHQLLRENLEAIGLEIVPTVGGGFEVAGVERATIEKFSRRTMKIEETAARLGITDPVMKAKLGAMTRERKDKGLTMTELFPLWESCFTPEEKRVFEGINARLMRFQAEEISRQAASVESPDLADLLGTRRELPHRRELPDSSEFLGTRTQVTSGKSERRRSMNQRTTPTPTVARKVEPTEQERRAVELAKEHLLARNSVVTDVQLMGEACNNWYVERTTFAGIKAVIDELPLLRKERDGWVYVTTKEIWNEERRLTELCLRGKGTFEAINSFWKIRNEELNDGQRRAVLLGLNSRDFITGISGVAGSGKTTLMRELKSGVEAGMYKALVLAPLAATAYDTLRNEGFEKAETIAKFLKSEALQNQARGNVLLVDEAGLISTKLADRFLHVAKSLGARVILVGDAGQHHSVERGRAFEHLRDSGKMEVADVTEILRQQGPYKQFVEMCVAGETRQAVTSLWSARSLVQQPLHELAQTVAADYVAAIERGDTALATSPTHAEGDILTEAIRQKMKERNLLGKSAKSQRLRNLEWSEEQKREPGNYWRGIKVQFNGRVKGFELGERVEVIDVREDVVRVRSGGGIKPLPLREAEKFEVYGRENIEAVKWETLRNLSMTPAQKSDPDHYEIGQIIKINDHVKGFALGEQMEVIGKSDEGVRVRSHANTFHPRIKALPLSQPEAFGVYERKTIELCEGDELLITGNGYTADNHRLNNGSQHQIDHITRDGDLVLENGWKVGKEFQHLSHGWVLTSYAAQGKTVDWVFACQTQELSAMATNYEQYHVATTRGRKGMISYTDNFEWLKDAVSERQERLMATELMNEAVVEEPTPQDQRLSELEQVEASREVEAYNSEIEPDRGATGDAPKATKLSVSFGIKDATISIAKAEAMEQVIENAPAQRKCEAFEMEMTI
jgi:conjugative relaxase-like TrwC/TraI family protein